MIENKINSMDALLARYVAGSLPKPIEVLVASHLELSDSSRELVRGLEACGGEFLADEDPVALTQRDACIEAILSSDREGISLRGMTEPEVAKEIMPRALHDFIGYSVDTIPWKTKMPGFREYEMGDVDGCHVSMFWIKPGRKIPSHTHEGLELTLVLDGAFSDSHGRYGRGDISIADETVDHRPSAEQGNACICFAVTDGPLRLTGPLHQRIADIIGAN